MRLLSVAVLLLAIGSLDVAGAAATHLPKFRNGASSTGWISFEFRDGKEIFIPAKINGHETEVLLANGLLTPDIDKGFAASIGLFHTAGSGSSQENDLDADGVIHGLQIQIGNLTLPETDASEVDFAALSRHLGHPVPLLLGDNAFDGLVMDIDFAHHRIALRDPSRLQTPAGAARVPIIRAEGNFLVPFSIEDAAPVDFELGLGNSGDLLVYQSYYKAHKLLEGRRLSKRLGIGSGGIVPEPIGTLRSVQFAGFGFENMPAAFIPASLAGTQSSTIAGDLGLPLLARFRLIIDYSHNWLYAIPYADSIHEPFPKDRLGLWLNKKDAGLTVEFVAPDSPASSAGFRIGDKVAQIDGRAAQAWSEMALADLRYRPAGNSLVFTMQDGSVRRVKLADYF